MLKHEKQLIMKVYGFAPYKIKRYIQIYILRRDKGEFWSETLRVLYKKHYELEIGMGSYGCFKPNQFPRGTSIGNYTSIANEVRYLNGNHPKNFVSTHPMFYNSKLGFVKEDKIKRHNLSIGNDVWIGYGSIIVSSCTIIGDGSIVAAGSVVTKNVLPYTIVAGVPAKVIGERFSKEIANEIQKTGWFNRQPKELKKFIQYFESPSDFIRQFPVNG